MKENVCTGCAVRQCPVRSYDRETCPRGLRPQRLLLRHFQIKEPAIDFDTMKITRQLMAEVIDTSDAVIVTAIRKEAARQGFTDLYLIDRELVKKVIEGAAPRRGRWLHDEYDCRCSFCSQYCEINDAGDLVKSKYCPNCGAKMDGEEDAKQ